MFSSARDHLREKHLNRLEEDADTSAAPFREEKKKLEELLANTEQEPDRKKLEKRIEEIQQKINSCYSAYGNYLMKDNV